jgi:hypothetical protein
VRQVNTLSTTRRTIAVLLFLAIVATAWWSMHEALREIGGASHQDIVFNPGYQHAQRLEVATARAAMDAIGMTGADQASSYQADYRLQRMQIQADSAGLERWAVHDVRHQGLLREIRGSLAAFLIALDQTSGSATAASSPGRLALLPALNRVHSALSNYAANLTRPANLHDGHYLFDGPVLLWWLLILLLVEVAVLAWLVFSMPASANDFDPPL